MSYRNSHGITIKTPIAGVPGIVLYIDCQKKTLLSSFFLVLKIFYFQKYGVPVAVDSELQIR